MIIIKFKYFENINKYDLYTLNDQIDLIMNCKLWRKITIRKKNHKYPY